MILFATQMPKHEGKHSGFLSHGKFILLALCVTDQSRLQLPAVKLISIHKEAAAAEGEEEASCRARRKITQKARPFWNRQKEMTRIYRKDIKLR